MGFGLGLGVNELFLIGICMEGEKYCYKDNKIYMYICICINKSDDFEFGREVNI